MALKHGMTGTPEYNAYIDAKCRCKNETNPRYPWYGSRGIKFMFDSFEQFYAEIGDRPSSAHSLDRINNSGHYEPGNIRWATKSEQVTNRRDYDTPWLEGNDHNAKEYIVIHPNGKKESIYNMAEFCRKHGLDKANLHSTISGKRAKTHKGFRAEFKGAA